MPFLFLCRSVIRCVYDSGLERHRSLSSVHSVRYAVMGGHSSFPSLILNSYFSFATCGLVACLYLVVMDVVMDAVVVALARGCWEVYLCSLLVD